MFSFSSFSSLSSQMDLDVLALGLKNERLLDVELDMSVMVSSLPSFASSLDLQVENDEDWLLDETPVFGDESVSSLESQLLASDSDVD